MHALIEKSKNIDIKKLFIMSAEAYALIEKSKNIDIKKCSSCGEIGFLSLAVCRGPYHQIRGSEHTLYECDKFDKAVYMIEQEAKKQGKLLQFRRYF